MFGLPTHTIYAVKANGEKESLMFTDCSNKAELIKDVKWYIRDMIKHNNTKFEDWVSFKYENSSGTCLCEVTADEIFDED